MRLLILLIIPILTTCNNNTDEFYLCAKKAGLFSKENTYPIRFDTNKTYRHIKVLSNQIRDTLQALTSIGFLYNYADSSFVPNANPMYNLVIQGVMVVPNNYHVSLSGGHLILFVSQDSLEIFNEFKNTHQKYHENDYRIRESINDYYNTAYTNRDNIWRPKYTHIVIPDSFEFKEYLLPYFRLMMNAYKQAILRYTKMKNLDICDSIGFWKADYEVRGPVEFMVLVDDFDYEKKKVNPGSALWQIEQ